jgi:hypothetical protein
MGTPIIVGDPPAPPHPGMVLRPQDLDYTDLVKAGKITIAPDPHWGILITVSDFEFATAESCRIMSVKAMAWARDVLNAQIAADVVVPGGRNMCGVD